MTYVPYSDSVEHTIQDEDKVLDDMAATMRHIGEMIGDRARHGARAAHAKSHGLLKGELSIDTAALPEPLRQGLFSRPGAYPAIIRFSTAPGDMLPDSISTPRGMAVKVIGVEGEKLPGHEGNVTQDFVFVNAKESACRMPARFWRS